MEEYSKNYYKAINNEEKHQAKALSEVLTEMYNPNFVVDLGCGTGLYLKNFKCDYFGYDISEEAFGDEVIQIDKAKTLFLDLTQNIIVDGKVDLVLCLEVVEHIGCEFVDKLVENITSYSDTVVMSAAGVGQAGLNHVNLQPQKYWDEKFEKHGYERDYHDEFKIIQAIHKVPHTIWIIRNLMVYKKQK